MIELISNQMIMNFQLIRIIIALAGTSVAAYFDIFNNRNIPDKLLYTFIIISIVVAIIDFNVELLTYTGIIAILATIIGYTLYRAGQLGLADVFVIVSLILLLPKQPTLFAMNPIISLPFILSIVASAGLLLVIYVTLKYVPKLVKDMSNKKIKFQTTKSVYSALMITFYFIMFYLLSQFPTFPINYLLIIGVLVILSIFFTLFKDRINSYMVNEISLKKIEEGDIIAIENMDETLVKKYSISKVFTENMRESLKKSKISKFPVYTDLPMFLPFILAGLILSIVLGDLIYLITFTTFGA